MSTNALALAYIITLVTLLAVLLYVNRPPARNYRDES